MHAMGDLLWVVDQRLIPDRILVMTEGDKLGCHVNVMPKIILFS